MGLLAAEGIRSTCIFDVDRNEPANSAMEISAPSAKTVNPTDVGTMYEISDQAARGVCLLTEKRSNDGDGGGDAAHVTVMLGEARPCKPASVPREALPSSAFGQGLAGLAVAVSVLEALQKGPWKGGKQMHVP